MLLTYCQLPGQACINRAQYRFLYDVWNGLDPVTTGMHARDIPALIERGLVEEIHHDWCICTHYKLTAYGKKDMEARVYGC